MELSLNEAAALLCVRPRTLRDRLQRGEIVGRKVAGRWLIRRAALPLDERQRRDLHARADELREALESALPSRAQQSRGREPFSVRDRDAFVVATQVLREIEAGGDPVAQHIGPWTDLLCDIAEAVHVFTRTDKLAALQRARRQAARVAGCLLASSAEPVGQLGRRIEIDVLPVLSGWIRWLERRGGRHRGHAVDEDAA